MALKTGLRGIRKIIAEKMRVTKVYVGDMMMYDGTLDPDLLLPLTFIAEQANSRVALTKTGSPAWEGEYSLDNENWLPYVPSTTGNIALANIGDRVYFRGNISNNFSSSNYLKFTTTAGRLRAEGNVNSMYVAVDFEELGALTYSYCYNSMFYGCTRLTAAPKFPATTLATYCYNSMFRGCNSLTTAPELPATTLTSYCYQSMFYSCTALTTAPALPATTLASDCYSGMFQGCKNLTTAPELPATTLATSCYTSMFYGCASLNAAPELPATTLATNCYISMFQECNSLTAAPELPATTLETSCYNHMFRLCKNLTAAPELPATTLASNCYNSMFYGCNSLTTAPELPATTLETSCYSGMFSSCALIKVSLTKEGIYQNTWQFGQTLSSTYATNMFLGTGGTFAGTPTVDVLYTSNDLV